MESEARYARIGAATLALLALLVVGLYWLGRGGEEQAGKRFVVYFQKQSLEGLQINSDVRMQGIKVGKVVDYAIMPDRVGTVRVVLKIDHRTPVYEGAQAIVARHLVTGLAAIDIENPAQGGVPLMRVTEGEKHPVIAEGVPQLTKVADTLETLGAAGQEALDRFNQLMSDRNLQSVSATLAHLDAMTGELSQTMPVLRETVASTGRAAAQIEGLGGEARVSLKMAGELLGQAVRETSETLAAARVTLDKADRELTGLSSQVKLTADLASQEIQSTAQSLRMAGDALQDTGRALSNPSRVLYGPSEASLGPGEEMP